jgi:hypothetical protein
MTLAQDFEDFVKLLNKHQVDYMVVGGYALAFHGKPRHTGDLDIWINSSEANAEKLFIAIKEFGLSSLGLTNIPAPWIYLKDAVGAPKFVKSTNIGFRVQRVGD